MVIAKTASSVEGRNFQRSGGWMISNLFKIDSPNCDTETANRTLQTGSLTVPADGYTVILQMAVIVM
jgi:hypothetical protein